MRQRMKISVVFILVSVTMILCGWLFKKKEFVLDTEKRILYQHSSVNQIIADMEKNSDTAKEKYDDGYYAVSGEISDISKNKKTLFIGTANDGDTTSIECTASDKALIEKIEALKNGENVKVYGKVKVSSFRNNVSMEIAQITSVEASVASETMYSYIDGKTYDSSNMVTRNLADGKVKYYIPRNWIKVEKDIINSKLGNMEGYQYTLNEISGELAVEPESIFVCYFDSKTKLKDRSQKSKTKEIRKTIIDNILQIDGKGIKAGEIKEKKSYYGTDYYYYDGAYTDKQEQGHHVEFVFQENANDGMIVYLYVYKEENLNHMDDILCVMRCLEIE